MAQFTDFGKRVKIALIQRDMTQEELIRLLREKTGMYVDDSYMWKILSGARNPKTLVDTICEILELPAEEGATE